MLNECDKELEWRGHLFVSLCGRYGDSLQEQKISWARTENNDPFPRRKALHQGKPRKIPSRFLDILNK